MFSPLEGEIDLHVSARVESSLASIIAKRPEHVVVDLSGATLKDSSGLAVLINAMQDVKHTTESSLSPESIITCDQSSK
jgi:anti-anti-sigma factor